MPDEPLRATEPDPEDRSVLARSARAPDATWAYGAHRSQVVDAYLPADTESHPCAVLIVHGGFWRPEYDRAHVRPMAAALADLGVATLLLEYRRLPGDPDATTADLRAAVRAIPDLLAGGAAARRGSLLVVGHSAGGHLALWLAAQAQPGVAGCLALAPVADLVLAERLGLGDDAVPDFLGGRATSRPDLDPCLLPQPTIPVTVVHGVQDTVVPISLSRSYLRPATRLVEVPCAHFELIDPRSGAWSIVVGELARQSGGAAAPDAANLTADPHSGIEWRA